MPSRQKNCDNCVRGRRRCDRRRPICSRCAERKITCSISSQLNRVEPAPTFSFSHTPDHGNNTELYFDSNLVADENLVGPVTEDSQSGFMVNAGGNLRDYAVMNDDMIVDPFFNLFANDTAPAPDEWLVPIENNHSTSPVEVEITRAYDKIAASFCNIIKPWDLYDSKAPLHYIVNRVKDFTNDIAKTNATPFIHRYLYKHYTPQCILTCFTTNVLYANRTPVNTGMVIRGLGRSVTELIDSEACGLAVTPLSRLARTQALFLYQIIRLLDGDVMLRSQGEKDNVLLKMWVGELCKVRENLGDEDLAQNGNVGMRMLPPRDWEGWIFAESLRRTIVMAYSFISLYEMMTHTEKKDDPSSPWTTVHQWTLSQHLWEADSSFEFARTWKNKPHFTITNYSFEHFLQYGRGEDVDEFAEVLLSVYMGVDETKEFMSFKK